jgi:hypothetical protein
MSGTGHFYEVLGETKHSLVGLRSKGEWYNALGPHLPSGTPDLNAYQALTHGWISALRDQPPPLRKLFTGDLRTDPDGTGDPEVVFLGANLVKDLSQKLSQLENSYFLDLLKTSGEIAASQIWLLEPMQSFFSAAASRYNAVLVFWGD